MTTVVEMIGELANGDLTPESGLTFLTSMEDHLRLANATSSSEMNLVTPQYSCFIFNQHCLRRLDGFVEISSTVGI